MVGHVLQTRRVETVAWGISCPPFHFSEASLAVQLRGYFPPSASTLAYLSADPQPSWCCQGCSVAFCLAAMCA